MSKSTGMRTYQNKKGDRRWMEEGEQRWKIMWQEAEKEMKFQHSYSSTNKSTWGKTSLAPGTRDDGGGATGNSPAGRHGRKRVIAIYLVGLTREEGGRSGRARGLGGSYSRRRGGESRWRDGGGAALRRHGSSGWRGRGR